MNAKLQISGKAWALIFVHFVLVLVAGLMLAAIWTQESKSCAPPSSVTGNVDCTGVTQPTRLTETAAIVGVWAVIGTITTALILEE